MAIYDGFMMVQGLGKCHTRLTEVMINPTGCCCPACIAACLKTCTRLHIATLSQ
jgi:hypothetical protein